MSTKPPMDRTDPEGSIPAAPDSRLGRIPVLDVLRGLALVGMFVVHFNYYEGTPRGAEPGAVAAFVERFIGLLVEGRFYAIFGMLFGVGFAVQLARADARGAPFVARFLRRLAMLAVFGFIAEGIFGYNVLFGYAMWGVPLLLVRRWPTPALVALLIVCAASRPVYNIARIEYYDARPGGVADFNAVIQAQNQRFTAAARAHDEAERAGDWRTVVSARVAFMPEFHRQWSKLPAGSFTLFLLGMIAFRMGLFTRPGEHRRLIISLMIGGALSWAVAVWVLPMGGPAPPTPLPDRSILERFATVARFNGLGLVRYQWLAFTYVGAILLLVAHNPDWLRRLSPLAWAGRMALTNYMMQVVLLDVLFTPHGFGFTVPALLVIPGAITLFGLQVATSRWWLSRFRSGPLEWIWRSFTYWQLHPLRLGGEPATRVVPA
jgi:uncharacterized protein